LYTKERKEEIEFNKVPVKKSKEQWRGRRWQTQKAAKARRDVVKRELVRSVGLRIRRWAFSRGGEKERGKREI